ncbi:MAG: type I 3-dehydroquinate dehydratase, partial [Bacillus sp. (in: Bacteria)]|nr:type I 3-dehydroquinate dehydratase [Bacillus sp. (in: firmicutes)]
TPSVEEIINRLRKAQELGADIPKLAVMPASNSDVLTLLEATNTMSAHYADRPFITISMGKKGLISRLAGFGSVMTFGTAGKRSAPGQVDATELRKVLTFLESNQ